MITNTDSIPYVEKVFDKVRKDEYNEFDMKIVTISSILEKSSEYICPQLMVNEDFCDVLLGSMTPLLLAEEWCHAMDHWHKFLRHPSLVEPVQLSS